MLGWQLCSTAAERQRDKRMMSLAIWLVMIAALLQSCKPNMLPDPLSSACDYLWSMQADGGGWHSETHGIMKGGSSVSPFVLWHLLQVPDSVYSADQEKEDRAMTFVRNDVSMFGEDAHQMVVDYPNYTLSYALRILSDFGDASDQVFIQKIVDHLIAQQFDEDRGIAPDHPAYGGWGFGETDLAFGTVGHVDISHTRRILQALRPYLAAHPDVARKARIFIYRHQNGDGGGVSSLVTTETNKSRQIDSTTWASYATATCDMLLAMSTISDTDHRATDRAWQWLQEHPELSFPQGIPLDDPLQWHLVMRLYYLYVRAEASAAMGHGNVIHSEIMQTLEAFRQPDGSYINPLGAPNKEDDPLIGTTFAIAAMIYSADFK